MQLPQPRGPASQHAEPVDVTGSSSQRDPAPYSALQCGQPRATQAVDSTVPWHERATRTRARHPLQRQRVLPKLYLRAKGCL